MKAAIMDAIKGGNKEELITLLTNAKKGSRINLKYGTDEVLYEKTGKRWRYTRWDNGMLTYSTGGWKPEKAAADIISLNAINPGWRIRVK